MCVRFSICGCAHVLVCVCMHVLYVICMCFVQKFVLTCDVKTCMCWCDCVSMYHANMGCVFLCVCRCLCLFLYNMFILCLSMSEYIMYKGLCFLNEVCMCLYVSVLTYICGYNAPVYNLYNLHACVLYVDECVDVYMKGNCVCLYVYIICLHRNVHA